MERVLSKDRVALVTGETKGIGEAICMHLAEHGCRVACGSGHDRKAAEAQEESSYITGQIYGFNRGLYM